MSTTRITRRDHCSRSLLGIAKNRSASADETNGQSGVVREFAALRAPVSIVRTELAVPLPGMTDEGEKLAVAPAGSPDALRLTGLS